MTPHRPCRRALPDTYLLVERMDAVRIAYIFVYADSARPLLHGGVPGAAARQRRWHPCTVLVVCYLLLMVALRLSSGWRSRADPSFW